MAWTGNDSYVTAAKQNIRFVKTTTRTTIATAWFSLFDIAGEPGAGTLAGSSITAGVVPTDATAGYPNIDDFGGLDGRLTRMEFGSSVACRIRVYDRLFLAGAYAFNANQALSAQPSYLGRVPGGNAAACAGQTELWAETVTAATGNQTWNVTYTNEAGTASRTTGAVGIGAAPTLGRCFQLPLQAGDKGVSLVTNVAGGTGSVGTANIMVLRPLWTGRVLIANDGDVHDYLRTGLRSVFQDSALYVLVAADSTSSGIPELEAQIARA